MHRLLLALVACVVCFAVEASQSVGLVLSGGGAKGIAHIGVIQALEDNDIPIDYVAGTSMGSIVGGLYAMGYTPAEMLALIRSKEFQDWSTGTVDPHLTYYYARKPDTPKVVSFEINLADSTAFKSLLPESLINPLPMNYGFLELFSASTAQCGGDFDRLFVPFRCVTSDVYAKRMVVVRSGDVGRAIRSSMSFPVVFKPIMVDSVPMFDGGIYDNYPFDVMNSEFAPDVMIGVDVTAPDAPAAKSSMVDRIEAMVIQDASRKMPPERGITIRLDLKKYSLLDFNRADEIYRLGYDRGLAMIDSIKGRVSSRRQAKSLEISRKIFRAKTPDVLFDSVAVRGGTESQNRYINALFTKGKPDTLSLDNVRDSYYRAITPGKFSDLSLTAQYKPQSGMNTLLVDAEVKNNFRVGVGGYASSATNSFLFLSTGYSTLSYNSLDVDINGWLGQELIAGTVSARMALRTAVRSALGLEAKLSRHKWADKPHMIFDDYLPNSLTKIDNFVRVRYTLATSLSGKVDITVGYGRLTDRFYDFAESDMLSLRDRSLHRLGRVEAVYDYNKLDDNLFPTVGTRITGSVAATAGNSQFFPSNSSSGHWRENVKWLDASFAYTELFDVARYLSLGLDCRAVGSTRKLLPTYMATLSQAPQFTPTAACANRFNADFRAFSSAAVGGIVVAKLRQSLQLRANIYGYMPVRRIMAADDGVGVKFGRWFGEPEAIGQLDVVYSLPFAKITAYANYTTTPADRWTFGVSLGAFILPDTFLR